MISIKKPIAALIFDAGDVLVHKKPDETLNSLQEFSQHELEGENSFSELYERIRILGEQTRSKFLLYPSNEGLKELNKKKIDIRLFEEYEIEKWWNNPDSSLLVSFQRLSDIGYKIGILTDSVLTSNKIRNVLEEYSAFISCIVSSRDLGVMKPHPKMYNAILSELNISAEYALFIAHDLDELEGAQKLQINTINYEEIGDLNLLVKQIEEEFEFYKKV